MRSTTSSRTAPPHDEPIFENNRTKVSSAIHRDDVLLDNMDDNMLRKMTREEFLRFVKEQADRNRKDAILVE
jgi:hypothetical protein